MSESPSTPSTPIGRRTIATGAAWAVPVLLGVQSAPLMAASAPPSCVAAIGVGLSINGQGDYWTPSGPTLTGVTTDFNFVINQDEVLPVGGVEVVNDFTMLVAPEMSNPQFSQEAMSAGWTVFDAGSSWQIIYTGIVDAGYSYQPPPGSFTFDWTATPTTVSSNVEFFQGGCNTYDPRAAVPILIEP